MSWIVIHEQHTSIDEILRYPSSKGLTRIDKQNMLINSFALICDLSIEDRRMYALASFIALVIQPDIDSETIFVAAKEKLVDWSNYSDTFYKREIERIGTITPETEELYVLLFPISSWIYLITPFYRMNTQLGSLHLAEVLLNHNKTPKAHWILYIKNAPTALM